MENEVQIALVGYNHCKINNIVEFLRDHSDYEITSEFKIEKNGDLLRKRFTIK
jgi:hypothetical protein